MKKLLALLNEFKKDKMPEFIGYNKEYGIFYIELTMRGGQEFPEEIIISKKYGFIKWLVDNNKIRKFYISDLLEDFCGRYETYKKVLMYLSVKDDPIDILIDMLK